MADSRNSGRDRSAPPRTKAQGDARQTVLLSDLPETLAEAAAPSSNPTLRRINLSPDTLAALGVRYEILADAGSGSMGNVYKARDRETGGVVALKLLKPEIASDRQMMDRFKRELLFARKITHKNVCRVYEFNRVNGVAYTSMEFVEGESLRATLNRVGKIPAQRATEIALQICSGLKEAHVQGIVHRDLKPENVMIDSAGNVKIMDFGIARSMDAGTRLTGSLAGTPAYMAPEQVAGKPVDYRTDIYSIGLVLYEMFTGVPAFKAENSVAVALKQMSEDVVPPHLVEPAIPVSIERTILKCLEKEPERRYLSIAELETALASPHTERTVIPPAATAAATPNALTAAPPKPPPAAARHARLVPTAAYSQRSGASPVLWMLVGIGIAVAAFGSLRALAIQKAANQIVFNEKFKPPVPPEFAYTIPKPPMADAEIGVAGANAGDKKKSTDDSTLAEAKPVHVAQPVSVAKKPAPTPEVFPRMETAPVRNRFAPPVGSAAKSSKPTPVTAVPNEYVFLGRCPTWLRAREKQKVVGQMMFPSSIVRRPDGRGTPFVLYVGPIKVSRAAIYIEALEAKGFSKPKEVSASEFERAGK
jgi:Protein kinase domain